ncbi:MAG TPA: hypothetical protein VFG03_13655 [Telluria sp.]|nr:hypothetical protein [Telluria sp.]
MVTLIEVVPRSSTTGSSGTGSSGSVGSSGTSGSTAAGSSSLYRVTLRMDDGSTRVVTQEWAPSFRSGDRVRVEKGMIQR